MLSTGFLYLKDVMISLTPCTYKQKQINTQNFTTCPSRLTLWIEEMQPLPVLEMENVRLYLFQEKERLLVPPLGGKGTESHHLHNLKARHNRKKLSVLLGSADHSLTDHKALTYKHP